MLQHFITGYRHNCYLRITCNILILRYSKDSEDCHGPEVLKVFCESEERTFNTWSMTAIDYW